MIHTPSALIRKNQTTQDEEEEPVRRFEEEPMNSQCYKPVDPTTIDETKEPNDRREEEEDRDSKFQAFKHTSRRLPSLLLQVLHEYVPLSRLEYECSLSCSKA